MSKKMQGSTVSPTPQRARHPGPSPSRDASAAESGRKGRSGKADDDRVDDDTESNDEADEAGSEMDEER